MKINKIILIIKGILYFLFVFLWDKFYTAIAPIVTNDLAIRQMENNDYSSIGINLFSIYSNYQWLIIIGGLLFIFLNEITILIEYIIKRIKEI